MSASISFSAIFPRGAFPSMLTGLYAITCITPFDSARGIKWIVPYAVPVCSSILVK